MPSRLGRVALVIYAAVLLVALAVGAAGAGPPPGAPLTGPVPNCCIRTIAPNPNVTATPPARAIDFDVFVTVSSASLADARTTMASLCPNVTVSVSTATGVYTVQGHSPVFSAPKNVTAVWLASVPSAQLCDARYTNVNSYATMYITANYNGPGGPFAIGPSGQSFYENPTTLTAQEQLSPYTGNEYRTMSMSPMGQPMAHPTNNHRSG